MNYKSFYIDCDQKSMDIFHSSLDDDIKQKYILNPEPIHILELNCEQLLSLINSTICKVHDPNQSSIEDMFNFYSGFPLMNTLDLMIELFSREEKIDIEPIRNFYYPHFICYVLFLQKEIKNEEIICKAIQIFTYILYIDNEIINLIDYINYYLFSDDWCTHYNIYCASIPIIGYLFMLNIEYATTIVNDTKLMDQLFKIAQNPEHSKINCSHALKLVRTMIYYSINSDGYAVIQPQYMNKIVIKLFHYLKSSIPHVTDEALKLLQVITTDLDLLNIAKSNGLERFIVEALGNLDDYQMISVYNVIRNIIYFAHEGKIQTKIINHKNFFTKTADLIKSNMDEKLLDVIISTINLMGIGFWANLLSLGVIDSLLLTMRDNIYSIQKRICSLLLNFFKDADSEFRRQYCIDEIVETFIRMLDDDDDEFCIEIITNLTLILSSDPQFFKPMFLQFQYDQHLEYLSENVNQELAQLAQSSLDNFNDL